MLCEIPDRHAPSFVVTRPMLNRAGTLAAPVMLRRALEGRFPAGDMEGYQLQRYEARFPIPAREGDEIHVIYPGSFQGAGMMGFECFFSKGLEGDAARWSLHFCSGLLLRQDWNPSVPIPTFDAVVDDQHSEWYYSVRSQPDMISYAVEMLWPAGYGVLNRLAELDQAYCEEHLAIDDPSARRYVGSRLSAAFRYWPRGGMINVFIPRTRPLERIGISPSLELDVPFVSADTDGSPPQICGVIRVRADRLNGSGDPIYADGRPFLAQK